MKGKELRARMIDLMKLRRFSDRTIEAYQWGMEGLVKRYMKRPDLLNREEVQQYLIYLEKEKKYSWSSCNIAAQSIHFFYRHVLGWKDFKLLLPPKKTPRRIFKIFSIKEVDQLFKHTKNIKEKALLMTTYGAGLRVREVVHLQVSDIESSRNALRVNQGKGAKDRYSVLFPEVRDFLRIYYTMYHPKSWLFFSRNKETPLTIGAAQKIYYRAKERAGIKKGRGIHTLRHCFATHLLERNVDVYTIKRLLGHGSIRTTYKYWHVIKPFCEIKSPLDDLMSAESLN